MGRFLITSALPYINGMKHLGNLAASMLPADVHARVRRQFGDEVLFICATDEHGTPAEIAALQAGMAPSEFCAAQHDAQAGIYDGFGLSFDNFGRRSSDYNRRLTQYICKRLEEDGFVYEAIVSQAYSATDSRFLPDRYVIGTCPHCGRVDARGDQCDACGRLLDPQDLVEPRSSLNSTAKITLIPTRHLFLKQSAFSEAVTKWLDEKSDWPKLAISIARKWLTEGLQDRCITRDLEWGVAVDRPNFAGKVFYVWFDAPMGYISSTQEWSDRDPENRDWRDWWSAKADTRYIQFMGKDNVPFHTVSFPCSILGSKEDIRLPDYIKPFNWLIFEGGKFSTCQQREIFLNDALEALPSDMWRWWLIANAPEGDDVDFSVKRLAADVSKDLADVFGNSVNRVLSV